MFTTFLHSGLICSVTRCYPSKSVKVAGLPWFEAWGTIPLPSFSLLIRVSAGGRGLGTHAPPAQTPGTVCITSFPSYNSGRWVLLQMRKLRRTEVRPPAVNVRALCTEITSCVPRLPAVARHSLQVDGCPRGTLGLWKGIPQKQPQPRLPPSLFLTPLLSLFLEWRLSGARSRRQRSRRRNSDCHHTKLRSPQP